MILVKIYYNTDENNRKVPENVSLEDLPICYFGPFDDITHAISWMENDYPDDDPDVYEMVADHFDLSDDVAINAPDSIFGDQLDEDVRF